MTSKLRIKMGAVEVECEGSEQFLTKELPDILAAVSKLHSESGAVDEKRVSGRGGGEPSADDIDVANGKVIGTTATIAGKLGCDSGPKLIMAAAAHLTFVAKKAEFPRKDLLEEVKGATGYYNENIRKNLTNYLRQHVKDGHLLELRAGSYTLSAGKKAEIGKKLAS
jgi:hypothetical protein